MGMKTRRAAGIIEAGTIKAGAIVGKYYECRNCKGSEAATMMAGTMEAGIMEL